MGLQRELELQQEIDYLQEQKNGAYTERNALVAAFARLCHTFGLSTGLAEDDHGEPGFRMICYIDLPNGQVSWHICDADLPFFDGLPAYTKPWDGHQNDEKYTRLTALRWMISSIHPLS